MLALTSVWIALGCLLLSVGMAVYRPLLTDLTLWADLWGCCLAMALAGLVLWSHRKQHQPEPAVVQQRLQCKIAFGFSIVAAGIIYALIALAEPIPK